MALAAVVEASVVLVLADGAEIVAAVVMGVGEGGSLVVPCSVPRLLVPPS